MLIRRVREHLKSFHEAPSDVGRKLVAFSELSALGCGEISAIDRHTASRMLAVKYSLVDLGRRRCRLRHRVN